MELTENELWLRLAEYNFDDIDVDLPFSKRLARDNNWPQEFANKVIEEYKHFVYLIVISKRPLTPSDQVDQAWHLHMLYSREYWQNFCVKVLKIELHHGPTKGGVSEGEKFRDWYTESLNLYRKTFKYDPPADVWPSVYDRFQDAANFKRLNSKEYVQAKKDTGFSDLKLFLVPWIAIIIGATLFMTLGVYAGIIFILVVIIIGLVYSANTRARNKNSFGGGNGSGSGGFNNDSDDESKSERGSESDGGSGCGGGGCGGCGG